MYSTKSPPLHNEHPERDVYPRDLDADRASSNQVHRLRPDSAYRSSGFKNAQFRSNRPSIGRRLTRSLIRFFLPVFIGVGGTLAWQSYGGEMVRAWAPSLGWLLPASPPGPAVTSAELQQLARKQDQMAQAIATLQAAEQDLSQKILALAQPAQKTVHVAPRPAQPPAH